MGEESIANVFPPFEKVAFQRGQIRGWHSARSFSVSKFAVRAFGKVQAGWLALQDQEQDQGRQTDPIQCERTIGPGLKVAQKVFDTEETTQEGE